MSGKLHDLIDRVSADHGSRDYDSRSAASAEPATPPHAFVEGLT